MKGRYVTVTSKGQFTLPRDVREAMGVKAGDKVEVFVSREGETVLRTINKPASAIFGRGAAYAKGPPDEEKRQQTVADAVAARGTRVRSEKAG